MFKITGVTATFGFSATRWSKGSSQPDIASQCASRKTSTSPEAAAADNLRSLIDFEKLFYLLLLVALELSLLVVYAGLVFQSYVFSLITLLTLTDNIINLAVILNFTRNG